MVWKEMLAGMDSEEIAYQMALDIVEADEGKARREGVPTVSQALSAPAGSRIGAKDPNWYARLEKLASP
jgi:hypothetical protein